MKFIGQYIQKFIARFKNDVYLEEISSGTIASGGNLGLDSNNKIVKANEPTSHDAVTLAGTPDYITLSGQEITRNAIDLAADVTGTLPSGNVATLNQDTTGNAATADALTSGNKTIAGNVTVEVSSIPLLALKRTATGSDNDGVGTIRFTGNNDADEVIRYAAIDGKINDASDGAEEGKLTLSVSSHDNEMQPGVTITSGDVEDEVDVTIGNEATSVTTLAGTLTMGSTATLDNSGNLLTNAATATALATARNIAGVSFDGTGDISLNNNAITNGAGYTTNTGDITGITVSDGSTSHTTSSGAHTTQFLTGEGIDVAINALSGTVKQVTYSAEDASATNKGVVELATTGEADTGTDTARAVTPAGLKSHVDARYTNQIFSFTFSDLNYVSNTWTTPSQHGPTFYSWNNRHGSGQTQAASDAPSAVDIETTISVDYLDQGAGIVIPVASKFVGFYGNVRTNNTTPTSARPVFAIFRAAEPANDNNADIDATCIAFDSYDTATGNRKNRFMKLENFPGTPVDLAQGDILFPAIGLDETMSNNTGDILGSFTIVLRTLIP